MNYQKTTSINKRLYPYLLLFSFSINTYAGNIQFPIPLEPCKKLVYTKSTIKALKQSYPVLEDKADIAKLTGWKTALQNYIDLKNSSGSINEPLLMPIFPKKHLEVMIQKLKKADDKLTVKSITDNVDPDDLETFKKMNLDTQIILNLYLKWKKIETHSLIQKIKTPLQLKKISFEDNFQLATEFSTIIGNQTMFARFVNTLKKSDPIISENDFLNKLTTQYTLFLNDKNTYQADLKEFINDSFPFILTLPTFNSLSVKDFNKYYGFPIFNAGLVDQNTIADGQNYTPEGFYQHDLVHFKQIVFNLFKYTYAKTSTDENIFYNQMTDRLKTLSVNDLNASIQKIFQLNQVYGEYLNIINHQDNFTDRERIIAEILFFDFTHEDGKVFSNFQKLVDDYSKYLLPLTYDSKLSREFSRLLNGMNAGGKYHYEFPNDSSDVRASEIKTVIRKITSF